MLTERKKTRPWMRRIVLSLFSVVLVLLVAEGGLRFLARQQGKLAAKIVSPSVRHHKIFCEYDDQLGWRLIPGSTNSHESVEYTVTEVVNSEGMRGREVSLQKPPGAFRVLLLGDSYVEGYMVGEQQSVAVQLEGLLEQRMGRPVEVLNAGVGGYSTDQEYLLYKNEGAAYEPDVVAVLFFLNDVYYNGQPKYGSRGHKPYFVQQEGRLVLQNVPVPKEDEVPEVLDGAVTGTVTAAVGPGPDAGESRAGWSPRRWLLEHSLVYAVLSQRAKSIPWIRSALVRCGVVKSDGERVPVALHGVHGVWQREPYEEDVARGWEMTELILAQMASDVASHGSRFVVFYIPHIFEIYPAKKRAYANTYGFDASDLRVEQPRAFLAEICARRDIPFIDPVGLYMSRAKWYKPRLYYWIDEHWTADGIAVAAETLADWIAGPSATATDKRED